MNILFFFIFSLCRYVEINPKDSLFMKLKVTKDEMFKFIYNTFGNNKVNVVVYDNMDRKIGQYVKSSGVVYTKPLISGHFKIEIFNKSKEKMKFGYRCPDVNKEMQGALGPIKDVDAVSELISVLENNISAQRRQFAKYENHFELVKKSKSWVYRFVIFEIFTSLAIMYYLHKNTIKMFERKHVGN
ncbi:transmembrane EMP24 domain-containing protein [Vairimorpha necatrix]|uniref:Transmembrane EMP24 domain-containing protein n=1 Tax=Vairimorpha necatrix TaxID=6039 RepID=A0AAX4J953_9MICR